MEPTKRRLISTLAISLSALAPLGRWRSGHTQQVHCAPPASSVSAGDSVIRLQFANRQTVTLSDVPAGDGQTDYRYRGYVPAIGYHLVELQLWGGPSSWVELYDACTGHKLVLDAAPIVSPDSARFVTLGYGVPRGPLVKRLQVWSRTPSRDFAVEWDFELGLWAQNRGILAWGPINPQWLTPTSLRFDRVNQDGRHMGTASAHLGAAGWQFTVER